VTPSAKLISALSDSDTGRAAWCLTHLGGGFIGNHVSRILVRTTGKAIRRHPCWWRLVFYFFAKLYRGVASRSLVYARTGAFRQDVSTILAAAISKLVGRCLFTVSVERIIAVAAENEGGVPTWRLVQASGGSFRKDVSAVLTGTVRELVRRGSLTVSVERILFITPQDEPRCSAWGLAFSVGAARLSNNTSWAAKADRRCPSRRLRMFAGRAWQCVNNGRRLHTLLKRIRWISDAQH